MLKEDFEINNKKVKILIKKILDAERINLKTKKYSRSKMSDKIIKIIEEEIRKCY